MSEFYKIDIDPDSGEAGILTAQRVASSVRGWYSRYQPARSGQERKP